MLTNKLVMSEQLIHFDVLFYNVYMQTMFSACGPF